MISKILLGDCIELMEGIPGAEIQRWVQDNTQRGCENLSALENLEAVLLKHSKDV